MSDLLARRVVARRDSDWVLVLEAVDVVGRFEVASEVDKVVSSLAAL